MNAQYIINYVVLSAFLTLFIAELGAALVFVINRRYYPRVKAFITPLWGPIGTFAVFYLVNTEATYPAALSTVGTMYIALGMTAGLFFILRNAFIMYSEAHHNPRMDELYRWLYVAATLVVAFLVVTIFSSVLSGIGVNLSEEYVDPVRAMFNPFNALLFIAFAMMALSISYVQFNVNELGRHFPLVSVALSYIIAIAASWAYLPYFAGHFVSNIYLVAPSAVLAAAGLAAYYLRSGIAKYLMGAWLLVSIESYGALQYPYMFGGALQYTQFLNNSAMALYASYVTAAGGTMLAVFLAIFFYVNYLKRQ